MPDSTRPRKRGPQARAARNDRALIEAAREVFIAQGFDAPVSAIAERAGVGMGSLYRRYATKEELLQRLCADSMEHLAEAARAGLAIDDPWQGLVHYITECTSYGFGALAPLAGTIELTPQIQHAAEQARRFTDDLITRAHNAGALRTDATPLDIFLLIGQFSRPGPAPSRDTEQHVRSRLLAIAVDGLKATNTTPLPAPPPNPHEYQAMWATNQT
ncbi:TetR/AcrR family transcriptional regulator [Actinomadura madurae]|uniref:TetR/AcrR family transcriptional regulator n=1 Tax=Actinomadura madurae TaxID=1993 RepID=UPI0020D23540|nr:TetR/AcrR family transcriptional regulator [Actinomadura madurae]MCP9952371.1 TetR/AcrR family transcriptional regulator [Actinomadura madurae]MCP9981611.1 TetR/AcrR family transcriptional regulator [Actinomadura madurae]